MTAVQLPVGQEKDATVRRRGSRSNLASSPSQVSANLGKGGSCTIVVEGDNSNRHVFGPAFYVANRSAIVWRSPWVPFAYRSSFTSR